MRILDRYLFWNFFTPFIYCVLAFICIWLVIDLSDNGPDFIEGNVPLREIAGFYFSQLPDILVICLPMGLLLAVLYCLGRMSRSNEIISMLTAGLSLTRIAVPLLLVGVVITGVSLALNYSLAPRAQAMKSVQLEAFVSGREPEKTLNGHLFRNRSGLRTWYAERVLLERNQLHWVQISQQDEQQRIIHKYYVRNAEYRPASKSWYLDKGSLVTFDEDGNIASNAYLSGETIITDWDETPWRIASSNLQADVLSVPELREYLHHNSDFPEVLLAPFRTHLHYRFALPFACLLVVFMGTPLGVVFSRRGMLSNVASALVIFLALMFLSNLFLALGAGARIAPWAAAWLPNLLYTAIGLTLFYLRGNNRDFSSLNPFKTRSAI